MGTSKFLLLSKTILNYSQPTVIMESSGKY